MTDTPILRLLEEIRITAEELEQIYGDKNNIVDPDVLKKSQELDRFIWKYYENK